MPYQGPGTYLHYKGGLYEVLGLSVHEYAKDHNPDFDPNSPKSQYVVYRPLTPGGLLDNTEVSFWSRQREDFDRDVLVGGPEDWSRESVPRFHLQEVTHA